MDLNIWRDVYKIQLYDCNFDNIWFDFYRLCQVNNEKLLKDTNVSISKTISGAGVNPITITYTIRTPKVDDFDFVLALDSSGSFGYGGDYYRTQEEAVREAIPLFLNGIKTDNSLSDKNFKAALVSWDGDIDFAGNYSNLIAEKAKILPIPDVIKNVDEFEKAYICDENEFSDLSIPISASLRILDNKTNPVNPKNRTSRFIILVTGRSEFINCSNNLIEEARLNSYPIYIIGLDIVDSSKMFEHLNYLGDNNTNRIKFIRFIPSESNLLKDQLLEALKSHLINATNEPIMRNVEIKETLYPYINPDTRSIIVKGNGLKPSSYIKQNIDKTKTISLQLSNGLMPDSTTEVTLDAYLELGPLPVSVTEPVRDIPVYQRQAEYQPPVSQIDFNWINEKGLKSDKLPGTNVTLGGESSRAIYVSPNISDSPAISVPKIAVTIPFLSPFLSAIARMLT